MKNQNIKARVTEEKNPNRKIFAIKIISKFLILFESVFLKEIKKQLEFYLKMRKKFYKI